MHFIPSVFFILLLLISGCEPAAPGQGNLIGHPGTTYPHEREEYRKLVSGDWTSRTSRDKAIALAQKMIALQKARPTSESRDAGIQGWDDLGPGSVGGRVRGIAVNPNNSQQLFAGGVGGGVWVSNNGGAAWSMATDPELGFSVTSLAIHPANGNLIYATTGEIQSGGGRDIPGVGVLKSTDNGSTWQVLNVQPGSDFWLSKIVLNPLDPDILYVCGSSASINQNSITGTVYRSNDAGNSWQLLYTDPDGNTNHIYDININPADTAELFIGTSRRVRRSTNSGQNFNSMMGNVPLITTIPNASVGRCDLDYCEDDPDVLYVLRFLREDTDADGSFDLAHSEIWTTSNGGGSWTLLASTQGNNDEENTILNNQGTYDNIVWADPLDCSRAIFGGVNLWKWENNSLTRISDDDDDIGGNWPGNGNNSLHADQHAVVPASDYSANNPEVYIGNDGGVYKTNDIWSSSTNSGWISLVNNLNISQFYGIDVSLTGDTIYGGTQDNSFFVNRNVNTGSDDWFTYVRADGGHGGIKKSNPEIIYGSVQNGVFYKSTNGGDTYSVVYDLNNTSNGDDNSLFIAPFEIDPNDDTRLYAGGQSLWKSDDEGSTWSLVYGVIPATRTINTIEVAKGDANTIWLGYTGGHVYKTTNGGSSWQKEDVTGMPNTIVTDIAINPNNHDEVMITFGGGYNTNRTWITDDNGVTWTDVSLPFSMQVWCAAWHPENSNWIYMGTDIGIFASEDDGTNWNITPIYPSTPIGQGNDGPIFVPVSELVWQGNGTNTHPYYLVAGTHGRGIWRSTHPIRNKFYVDKTCNPCGPGSFSQPYATFKEAVAAAGNGSEIVFLSSGTYDEVPANILMKKRVKVTLHSSVSNSVIIE